MRYLVVSLLSVVAMATMLSTGSLAGDLSEQKLNTVVREFQTRLGMSEAIAVSIVEANEYLVSVQRSPDAEKGFIIQFERKFLPTLNDEEVRAVIAHELGHIWIFTHHPYLQTESLANEKALQLVSRQSLEQVYGKVWVRTGQKGTLQDFLAKVE